MVAINVTAEDVKKVQDAHIKLDASKLILEDLIITNQYNQDVVDTPAFKAYERRVQSNVVEFENAKKEISEKYLKGISAVSWNLDYDTKVLSYEEA